MKLTKEQIEEFIIEHGITVCPEAAASGSVLLDTYESHNVESVKQRQELHKFWEVNK